MTEKVFIDTNILVYSIDRDETVKRKRARELLKSLGKGSLVFLSTQVLQEFYVAATRKLGMDPLLAKDMLREWRRFNVVTVTPEIIEEAVDISILNRLSFWDGAVLAAARASGCEVVYTEDLNDGQLIGGIRMINPFR
jgi:predicted nucleic acid-binding protein